VHSTPRSIVSKARRLVKAKWQVSDANRRAKFHELTAAGRKALGEELAWWNRFVAGASGIVTPA
jgi:DNA-binding PadR family transcriptional regulator